MRAHICKEENEKDEKRDEEQERSRRKKGMKNRTTNFREELIADFTVIRYRRHRKRENWGSQRDTQTAYCLGKIIRWDT
jgi:hypothetical protein